jgi:Holliday junction resolvase-like predicted endonuclease
MKPPPPAWLWLRQAAAAVGEFFRPINPGRAGYLKLGRMGERAAERTLRKSGYSVIARNVRVPMGEADLVCRDPDRSTVVIVEVKTRLRRAEAPLLSNTVAPEAAITAHKRRKLQTIARHLARANGWKRPRIDVVAVEYNAEAPARTPPTIRHHINAVRG